MKSLILLIILVCQTSWALNIATPTRKTAEDSPETKIILNLSECVHKVKDQKSAGDCSKNYISKKLKPSQANRILMWFSFPLDLKYPESCSKLDTKFIPKETMTKTSSTLCSEYTEQKLKKRVIFLFTAENGKPRLHNIHEQYL